MADPIVPPVAPELNTSGQNPLNPDAGQVTSTEIQSGQQAGRQPYWPEGVNSEEEMGKWYQDNIANKVKPPEGTVEDPDKAATDKAAEPELTDDQIRENLKTAGGIYADPRYEPFAIEFQRKGDLTPESVKAAAAAFNVPENAITDFINGQKAQAEIQKRAPEDATQAMAKVALSVIPDAAQVEATMAWANANVPKSTQDAYNAALDRGDQDTVKALLGSFHRDFLATGEGPGRREITAQGGALSQTQQATSSVQPYANALEEAAAVSNPRFGPDKAYTDSVNARLMAGL